MTQVTGTAHQSESFVDAAKSLTKVFAEHAPDNDENDQFVAENYADLKTAGLISAGVPSDLGGGGASIRELCDVLKIIGGACGSTGLALSLHTHQVAVLAWRWYNQEAARDLVAPLLRRVADEKIVLLSSGGSDWLGGSGVAEKVEGHGKKSVFVWRASWGLDDDGRNYRRRWRAFRFAFWCSNVRA